jgi:hypothetical protein
MTEPKDGAARITLTRAHRGALFTLAACAAIVAGFPADSVPSVPGGTSPPPIYPIVAFALGVCAIGCRQAAAGTARSEPVRVRLAVAAYALAAAIGVVGIALVAAEGHRQTALVYALGGAILALRPPSALREYR